MISLSGVGPSHAFCASTFFGISNATSLGARWYFFFRVFNHALDACSEDHVVAAAAVLSQQIVTPEFDHSAIRRFPNVEPDFCELPNLLRDLAVDSAAQNMGEVSAAVCMGCRSEFSTSNRVGCGRRILTHALTERQFGSKVGWASHYLVKPARLQNFFHCHPRSAPKLFLNAQRQLAILFHESQHVA